MVLTRKIQITCKNKEDFKFLQEMLKQCRLMANKAMTNFYVCWQEMMDNTPEEKPKKKPNDYFKEKYRCSFQNIGYRYLRQRFPESPSHISRDVSKIAYDDFRTDMKKGLLNGERSLRNYRNGILPLHKQDMKIKNEESNEYILRWIKGIEFVLIFGRDRSDNKTIVDRIIDGTYKMSGSKIFKDWRKKKWYLLLCVDIPERDNSLLEDVVMGVDLGIAVPAVCALNNGKARAYIGNNILLKRFQMQKKQRGRQRGYIPTNSKHGRQKVDKAIFKMGNKERRFIDSFNHKISREIIKFALKHRASKIITEDLSGYDRNQTILRNWNFNELQTKLEYKAKKEKIKIEKISPRNTSRACSKCGYIDKENRKTQAEFNCLNPECGYEANADYNAALNIARGGVKMPEDMVKEKEEESNE
jgi:IS605 OrfB family transposase